LGPNIGALTPRGRPKAGLSVVCGMGSPPPAVRVRGYHPRKIWENSDAKFCILVTTRCEIFLLFENYVQEGGDQYIVPANLKVGGPVSHGPYVVAPMLKDAEGHQLRAEGHRGLKCRRRENRGAEGEGCLKKFFSLQNSAFWCIFVY